MSVVTGEMLILVRDAISKANACDGMRDFCKRYGPGACSCMHMAEAALAAVAPHIAKAERERCAVVAETHEWFVGGIGTKALGSGQAKAITAAIRALD